MRGVAEIHTRHPTKILVVVVVKRLQKEKHLPTPNQSESLVSQDLSVSLFIITLEPHASP